MSLHSLYIPIQNSGADIEANFPRSNVIIVGAQGGGPHASPNLIEFNLGHGIYAYPNINAGLLGSGGFNPFLYKVQGNSISIGNVTGMSGALNLFYVDDIGDLTNIQKRYPALSKFSGIYLPSNVPANQITVPESTPANQPVGQIPIQNIIVDLPSSNMTIWGLWLNNYVSNGLTGQDGSPFFIEFPTENGLPLTYMGGETYENVYPYIPMHYFSSAQKLGLTIGYNGGNSSTTASTTASMNMIFYYDFETVGREISRASPFEEYLPIAKATVKS